MPLLTPPEIEAIFSSYRPLTDWRKKSVASAEAAGTSLMYEAAGIGLAAANSGFTAMYLDPTKHLAGSRVSKLAVQAAVITNAVAPAITFTFHLYPVATWGGASGAGPTVATLGASLGSKAIASPASGGPAAVVQSDDFNFPSAGWHVLAVVTSGTHATNAVSLCLARLLLRQI